MSKLDELIKKYCPDEVEYKRLQNVLTIKNGRDYKNLKCGDIPVYGSGGIMTHVDSYVYNKPSVLIPRKGSIDKLYYVDVPFWNVDTIFYTEINTKIVLPRYVFHCLLKEHLEKLNTAGGVPSLTQKVLNNVIIPVPPLPVQEEIVRILDSFTSLTAELQAELQARKKQYEYYCELLLSDNIDSPKKKLGDTCLMKSGKAIKASMLSSVLDDKHHYPCYGGNGIRGYISKVSHHGEFPIIGRQGALCGNVNYAVGDFYATEHAVVVKSLGEYTQRYLFYLLKSMKLNQYKSQGAQPGLAVGNIENLEASVPDLEKQNKIVKILDRFDRLCNDLTTGIPAEIATRQKQYEYYRDKLLTFKELS